VTRTPWRGEDHRSGALRRAGRRGGIALHDADRCVSHALQLREIARAEYELAGSFVPVVGERGLERGDCGTAHSYVAVAPVQRVVAGAVPFISDADAASESYRAVDHQQPAMRPSIVFLPVVPLRAPEPANLAAGRLHSLQQRLGNFLRAMAIENQTHLDAALRCV